MRGAPLRFAAIMVGGWAAARIAMLWPSAISSLAVLDSPAEAAAPVAHGSPGRRAPHPARIDHRPASRSRGPADASSPAVAMPAIATAAITGSTMGGPPRVAAAPARADQTATGNASPAPPLVGSDAPPARSRLTVDGWLVLRPGGGDTLAFGQLGASQGGARLTYAIDRERRIALSARVSAPVAGSGREAGIGIDLRPTRLPVHLLVEERIDLESGGARPAAAVIAGGSIAVGRIRIDAYGQGGAVRGRGGFADGAALMVRPLLERHGVRLELGGGAWGAAQRRAARLDIGPSIALVTPGAGGTLRLQADYRARIAGRARPGSGPALTLGASF